MVHGFILLIDYANELCLLPEIKSKSLIMITMPIHGTGVE